MTRPPVAVVIGSIGKLPYAGMSLYFLHYIVGLQELGLRVHYVEKQNKPLEYYDPTTRLMTDDVALAVEYLSHLGSTFGAAPDAFTLLDQRGRVHGADLGQLRRSLSSAQVVFDVADRSWFDELELCPQRAFVDGDPMFTQAAMINDDQAAALIEHYPVLFSYGARIGKRDCTIPTCGRDWIPTRPVVATSLWTESSPRPNRSVSALLHWAAGSDVIVGGEVYGHKDREFRRYLDLPQRSNHEFLLAVGGRKAPRAELTEAGWNLMDPLAATDGFAAYQEFIARSYCDLGIAKHAYVASRSGWFSDRATCFLARGRPVLHEDTGFRDWLPDSDGILVFSDTVSACEALERLDCEYERHAKGARRAAELQFEARHVISDMLAVAGFR